MNNETRDAIRTCVSVATESGKLYASQGCSDYYNSAKAVATDTMLQFPEMYNDEGVEIPPTLWSIIGRYCVSTAVVYLFGLGLLIQRWIDTFHDKPTLFDHAYLGCMLAAFALDWYAGRKNRQARDLR